jgi:formaldehyde-activating enzyme involved in methanogenesis
VRKIILASAISFCLNAHSPLLFAEEIDSSQFSSKENLTETLLADDKLAVTEAQAELDKAIASGASQEEIDALQLKVTTAGENLTSEQTAINEQVAQLSDEQVIALNRSLNNAVSSQLNVNIDSAQIQSILDGNYDNKQINALTKALEEEAKFTALSGKFDQKYEQTGNEKFLEHSERMLDKADTQKEKFLGKIEKFDKKDLVSNTAREEAKHMSAQVAKDSVSASMKEDAKNMAKETAKSAAKLSAKEDAKSNAKDIAKQTAKQLVKEEGRQAAQSEQKELNKKNGKSKD